MTGGIQAIQQNNNVPLGVQIPRASPNSCPNPSDKHWPPILLLDGLRLLEELTGCSHLVLSFEFQKDILT